MNPPDVLTEYHYRLAGTVAANIAASEQPSAEEQALLVAFGRKSLEQYAEYFHAVARGKGWSFDSREWGIRRVFEAMKPGTELRTNGEIHVRPS